MLRNGRDFCPGEEKAQGKDMMIAATFKDSLHYARQIPMSLDYQP